MTSLLVQGFTISVFNRTYEKTELAVTRAKKEGRILSAATDLLYMAPHSVARISHNFARRIGRKLEGIPRAKGLRAVIDEAPVSVPVVSCDRRYLRKYLTDGEHN